MSIHVRPQSLTRGRRRLLRLSLPIADGASPRACLEAQIEFLISLLDHADTDPDLEETGDLEPSLGYYSGTSPDLELDTSDDEPSLGSLDRAIDQRRWNKPDCLNAACDRESQPYARQAPLARSNPENSGLRRPAFETLDRERNETRRLTGQLANTIARIRSRESSLAVRS